MIEPRKQRRPRRGAAGPTAEQVPASVTRLDDWKYRQVLRSISEAFGHPRDVPPCIGICECWGLPDPQGDAGP